MAAFHVAANQLTGRRRVRNGAILLIRRSPESRLVSAPEAAVRSKLARPRRAAAEGVNCQHGAPISLALPQTRIFRKIGKPERQHSAGGTVRNVGGGPSSR